MNTSISKLVSEDILGGLEIGGWCLHAHFAKELAYKYKGGADKQAPNEMRWCLGADRFWQAIGRYDLLYFKEQSCPHRWPEDDQFPFGEDFDTKRELLVPITGADGIEFKTCLDARHIGLLEDPASEMIENGQHLASFVVLTQIQLSIAAFDHNNGNQLHKDMPGSGFFPIRLLATKIHADALSIGLKRIPQMFLSLGSNDLTLVTLADDCEELHRINKLVAFIRQTPLYRVVQGMKPNERRGHACAAVRPVLAYRKSLTLECTSDPFLESERNNRIQLDFSMSVDCGHEVTIRDQSKTPGYQKDAIKDQFLEAIKTGHAVEYNTLHGDAAPITYEITKPGGFNWDTYVLRGSFKTFDAMLRVSKSLVWNQEWRVANLRDITTTVAIDNIEEAEIDHGGDHKSIVLQLDSHIVEGLEKIKNRLELFGEKYLDKIQNRELMSLYEMIELGFRRPDQIHAVRDLLPFIDQFSKMLAENWFWETYLNEQHDGKRITTISIRNELTVLIDELKRAYLNRMENQSASGDPPPPRTFVAGMPKVLGAYTVAAMLCSSLTRCPSSSEQAPEDDPLPSASYFATIVRAGNDGGVYCKEFFEQFRRNSERRGARELSTRSENEWCARLLSIELAGRPLLEPEIAVSHFFHEMFEALDWLWHNDFSELRKEINIWIGQQITDRIARLLSDADNHEELEGIHPTLLLFSFQILVFITVSYLNYVTNNASLGTADPTRAQVYAKFLQQTENEHPLAFMNLILSAVEWSSGAPSLLHEYCEIAKRPQRIAGTDRFDPTYWECPPQISKVPGILFESKLLNKLRVLKDNLNEIHADIGMVAGLHWFLRHKISVDREEFLKKHVNRSFQRIWDLGEESNVSGEQQSSIRKTLLTRWATQIHAFASNAEEGAQWMQEAIDEMFAAPHRDDSLKPTVLGLAHDIILKNKALLADEDKEKKISSLTARLRHFAPYSASSPAKNGHILPWTDQYTAMPNELRPLVDVFCETWCTPDDDTEESKSKLIRNRMRMLLGYWGVSTRNLLWGPIVGETQKNTAGPY